MLYAHKIFAHENLFQVEFPTEVTKTDTTTKLQLSCKDKMFDKIRNKHFATIFTVLGVTAKQLAAAQVNYWTPCRAHHN